MNGALYIGVHVGAGTDASAALTEQQFFGVARRQALMLAGGLRIPKDGSGVLRRAREEWL